MNNEQASYLILLAQVMVIVVGVLWAVVNWRRLDVEHLRQRLTDSEAIAKKCREDIVDLQAKHELQIDDLQREKFSQGLKLAEMERHAKRLGSQTLEQQRHIDILEWQTRTLVQALEASGHQLPDLDAHEY